MSGSSSARSSSSTNVRSTKERQSESLGRSIHSQDESLVRECKAAFLLVVDDVNDSLTSKQQLLLALQHSGRNPTNKVMDKHWKKGCSKLSFDEFCQICKTESPTTEDGLLKAFKKIDVNGDGYITHEELYRVMTTKGEKMSRDEVKAMIEEVDRDKDGKLDYKEFSSMILSTASTSQKKAEERMERREKRKQKKPLSSSPRQESASNSRSHEKRLSDNLKEVPRPSPRLKRSSNVSSHSPVADIKPKVHDPKNLAKWTHLHSNGCFHVEDKNSITSHQFTLTLKEESSVWFNMCPIQQRSEGDQPPVDTSLFILRNREDVNGKRLVTFTEHRDSRGAFCVRTDLDKGSYVLLPFTTGCRLHQRKSEPKPSKLLKDKDDNFVLTKAFKDALAAIFDMADLDGNGTLSREEFSWFNVRTSDDEVADDEWAVVEENFELKEGELTKKGFIELNQMEAEDNEGDCEDLWVTLSSMGFNKGLVMDEACPFSLDVYVESGSNSSLTVKSIETSASLMNSVVCESIVSKGECTKVKGAKDLSMYVYQNDYRTSIAVQNQANSDVSVRLDCSKCRNAASQFSLDHTVKVPKKSIQVGHHLMPKDEEREWTVSLPDPEVL